MDNRKHEINLALDALGCARGAEDVSMQAFNDAIGRIVAGIEKPSRALNDAERKTIACHETGRTIVALSLPGKDPVHRVSIIPRGVGALGCTIQRPTDESLSNRAPPE